MECITNTTFNHYEVKLFELSQATQANLCHQGMQHKNIYPFVFSIH